MIAQLSRLHLWVGLTCAIPLIVIGVSGIFLGFCDVLRYGSAPYRLEKPVAHPVGAAALAAAARSAYPGARLEVLYLPTAPERAARARLTSEAGSQVVVFLDPGTGKTILVRSAAERDLVDLLYQIHHGRIAGLAGEIIAAVAALSLVLLWLSGLPRRRRGGLPRHLHGRLGRMTGGVLACIALTGGVLAFAKPLRENLYPAPVTSGAATLPGPDLERMVSVASAAYAEAPLERVLFPVRGDQPLTLRFSDGGRVLVDGANGEVLGKETPYSPWINLLYPLHSGRILGASGPPLVAALGALMLFLTASGYLLRRRSVKKRWPAVGRMN